MFTVFIAIIQNYVCDLWNCITIIYVFFKCLSLLLGFLVRSIEFGDVKCL